MRKQFGFTLIELMMVIVIIAVLAAIAIPSYNRYIIKNAEEEARAQLGQLEIQLASWRATALSYRGFVPIADGTANATGGAVYRYSRNNQIFVPLGSNASNYRYVITIFDGDTGNGLATNGGQNTGNVDIVAGRSWGMIAEPAPKFAGKAKFIAVTSDGRRCQSVGAIAVNDMKSSTAATGCGNNKEKW